MSNDDEKCNNRDERYVLIKNYRNIGLEKPAKLVLNRSTQDGRMGDLVILVGANNAGKSNVIDAIESIKYGTHIEDYPEMMGNKANPEITLTVNQRRFCKSMRKPKMDLDLPSLAKMLDESNLNDHQIKVFSEFVLSGRFKTGQNFNRNLESLVGSSLTVPNMMKILEEDQSDDAKTAACHVITNIRDSNGHISVNETIRDERYFNYTDYISEIIANEAYDCNRLEKKLKNMEYDDDEIKTILDVVRSSNYVSGPIQFREALNVGPGRSISKSEMIDYLRSQITESEKATASVVARLMSNKNQVDTDLSEYNPEDFFEDNISENVHFKLGDVVTEGDDVADINIIRYIPNLNHKQSEFRTPISEPTKLFKDLFKFLGYPEDFLNNLLINYENMGKQPIILRETENQINMRMNKLNGLFNSMYLSNESPYRFGIYLEEDSVSLSFKKGNAYMKLDNQSVGFQWFFDFFFNIVLGDRLRPGDIVIMDEPATNLHVKGQVELRKTMKEYAKRHQITFVISTHSPFLIDCSYLDEVRIISRKKDGESFIENNFLTVPGKDDLEGDFNADKMDEILNALTVGRNVMMDPYDPLVFVEGITDYNYLTAFAKLLSVDDIAFMPIGGLKNEDLGNKLRAVTRDPILLVDADEAGYITKSEFEENKRIQVIALSDVDENFVHDYDYSDYKNRGEGGVGFTIEDLFSEADREWILQGRKESDFSSIFKTYIDEYEDRISGETKENFSKVFTYLKQEFMME